MGIDGEASGFEGRAVTVGHCRQRRRPGMGKRVSRESGCPALRCGIRIRQPGRRRAAWSAVRDLLSAKRFMPVAALVAATARTAATTDRPAAGSPLSVLRSEKSREAFIAAGIALMIAVG